MTTKICSNTDWTKADRWLQEPYSEPLETNDTNSEGLTPLDIYVFIWGLNVMERPEIHIFKKMITNTLKRFPLNKLYPELMIMLDQLNIPFDRNLFFNSNLELFPVYLDRLVRMYIVLGLPFIDDMRGEILNFV